MRLIQGLSIQSREGTRTRVRSLGGSRSAIELRPLDINSYSRIPSQYSGLSDVVG
jgi:hypothetical protein